MLHFGCRIAFGMDIGNFFQFECSFQGYRVIVSTAKIDEVLGIGKHRGEFGYSIVLVENRRNFGRDFGHLPQCFQVVFFGQCSFFLTQGEGNHR